MARVVDADRQTVLRAWTNPEQIVQWFGPSGFRTTIHEIDTRVGGVWWLDMIAPDRTVYSNRMAFWRIEPSQLNEFVHGTDSQSDPDAFRRLVTFDPQDNGKMDVSDRQMHPTADRRAIVIGFGAAEYGAQTWYKFADYVAVTSRVAAG